MLLSKSFWLECCIKTAATHCIIYFIFIIQFIVKLRLSNDADDDEIENVAKSKKQEAKLPLG